MRAAAACLNIFRIKHLCCVILAASTCYGEADSPASRRARDKFYECPRPILLPSCTTHVGNGTSSAFRLLVSFSVFIFRLHISYCRAGQPKLEH